MPGIFLIISKLNGNTFSGRNGNVIYIINPPTGWSLSDIQAFRRYTKAFVVGPGDHFPHTAVLSCPCHYHHLLCKTFIPSPTTSTPVFQPLRHGIHLIKTRLRDVWPPRLLQRYRWGLHWDRRLPSAYILPKHSRDWSKARPIVSYAQTVSAPLSQTVASAIYCLLQIVFPDLTSLSDVLPLLRHIWRVLQHYDPTDDLVLYQQDPCTQCRSPSARTLTTHLSRPLA